MNDSRNNIGSEKNKEDLKAWMESHPPEYRKMAIEICKADLFNVFLMG